MPRQRHPPGTLSDLSMVGYPRQRHPTGEWTAWSNAVTCVEVPLSRPEPSSLILRVIAGSVTLAFARVRQS
jgi:hypothetical protein